MRIVLSTRQQERVVLGLCTLAATVLFTQWPGLDLWLAGWLYRADGFVGGHWAWVQVLYRGMPWFGGALLVAALLVLAGRYGPLGRQPRWRRRRMALLLGVAVLGVGLLVHNGLKDHSGRPRPGQVQAFGGSLGFRPALDFSGTCPHNCSFVSGHAAGAFLLLSLGAFGSRRTRWRWWAIGTAAGGLVGLARVAQGGHFPSDIVFSLLAVWWVTVLLRELWLRVAARRCRRRQAARAMRAETREGGAGPG